jgi:uncharacterized membrane protein YtjA (UPF0391 family)
MSRGLAYWVIVLIWVISVLAPLFGFGGAAVAHASEAILLILFILLGWNVFGPPIHG